MLILYVFYVLLYAHSSYTFDAEMLEEFAVMMGAQQGASIANQAIESSLESLSAAMSADQNSLESYIKTVSNSDSQYQGQSAQALTSIETQAIDTINAQQKTQSTYSSDMQNYIDSAVSLHVDEIYYMMNPPEQIILDQMFTHGPMYTPAGPTWYNVFQIGDWGYEPSLNAFIQKQLVPLVVETTEPSVENSALKNSIFTEYITFDPSYSIECSITIYKISYPFLIGIQFNKSRWISGNADSATSYRTIAIYGTSDTNIQIFYVDQAFDASAKTNPVLYPLNQILYSSVKPSGSLPAQLFNTLSSSNPVTIAFDITNSAKSVQASITPTGSPAISFTATPSDPTSYAYHSIGFISAGAIAQYTLTQPTALTFSQTAQNNFEQECQDLITSSTQPS